MSNKINNLQEFLVDQETNTTDQLINLDPDPVIKCHGCNEEADYYDPTTYICIDCDITITI